MSVHCKRQQAAYDVIVVGGGMTGICAAIASARHGARTALVHDRPVLGGNASSEIRMHICGASTNMTKKNVEETGILLEIMLDNKAINDYYNYSTWDMVLFQAVKRQENLTVYLNTAMMDATVENSRVQEIECYQLTTEIRWRLRSPVFADCTGNGTLGYFVGAEFRTGSEGRAEFDEPHAPEAPNEERMGNTLLFKAVDRGVPVAFHKPEGAYTFTEEQLKYRKHADARPLFGVLPQEKLGETLLNRQSREAQELSFDAYCLDYGYWWIELPGHTNDIISEYEDIRDELVKCIYGIWDHIKNGEDHGAENYDLLWVGMMPGVRESRRLVGDYLLNENDVLCNRIFEDAVAYGGWPVDNHVAGGLFDFDKIPSFIHNFAGLYTIPYRSYYSRNIENLFIAGRDISTTKLAMSSTRVMGTCAVGGQAVGTAAALCLKYGCSPRGLMPHIKELQQTLIRDDCYIPGYKNEDGTDLMKGAKVSATTQTKEGSCENVLNGHGRIIGDDANCWESNGMGEDGEALLFTLLKPSSLQQVRLTFDPNLSRSVKITLSSKRMDQQQVGVPRELVKDYTVTLLRGGTAVREISIRDNHQRLNVLNFPKTDCDQVKVCVTATNGDPNARIFEVRAY